MLPTNKDAGISARVPLVGVVIPVFGHSVLVTEAINSALNQISTISVGIVLVNDGCRYEETNAVCSRFSAAYPDSVEYIRTENGGLSAARNRGIKRALSRWPSLTCVYLLDADNRISRGALRNAVIHMERSGADWIYPNIDKFGLSWSGDFSAPYVLLRHLFQNICEAGSLVSRRIFDRGIFFDESMRKGYEDWEFWLQCVDAGFRGIPFDDFGFEYRARRESMVRDAGRSDAEIMAYIHKKHSALFSWKNILRLEHAEAGRYAVFDAARRTLAFTSIPGEASKQQEMADFDVAFWGAHHESIHNHFPHFQLFSHAAVMRELSRLHLLDWVFWQMEDLLEHATLVFLDLVASDALVVEVLSSKQTDSPFLVATTRKCLVECSLDPLTSWIDSIRTREPHPQVVTLRVAGPFMRTALKRHGATNALSFFFEALHQLRDSQCRSATSWSWREPGLVPTSDLFRQVRSHMGAFAPLGRFAVEDAKEIAFLLPVVSFGGVEQVGMQIAIEFKRRGWRTRLVVTQAMEIKNPERLLRAFDTILFLNDPAHAGWNASGQLYYGHDLQRWSVDGRQDRLIGLVAGCAAVMNLQTIHGNEIMGWLRRQGIVTIDSLHLIDRDPLMAPVGHPYLMLAYEHAYDFIIAPSQQLLDVCHALGIPSAKLVLTQNAPTFKADPALQAKRLRRLEDETRTQATRPLRVLSLGRLDRQKGLDRLLAVIAAARAAGLPIEWRLVGSRVVENEAYDGSLDDFAGVDLHPAVYDRAAVIEHMMWADVLVMLSHWEGSPLTILEAQSLGTIPMVTDVGAVKEMVEDGETGVLLETAEEASLPARAVDRLSRLFEPSTRFHIARRATEFATAQAWLRSCEAIISKCERNLELKKEMR